MERVASFSKAKTSGKESFRMVSVFGFETVGNVGGAAGGVDGGGDCFLENSFICYPEQPAFDC